MGSSWESVYKLEMAQVLMPILEKIFSSTDTTSKKTNSSGAPYLRRKADELVATLLYSIRRQLDFLSEHTS